jgi:hypothetical protein
MNGPRYSTACRPWRIAVLLTISLVAGCSSFLSDLRPDRPASPEAAPAPQGTQVRVGGDGYSLGDVAQSALTPQQFADRAEELLRARRPGAAARWVQRYPDMALTVLTDGNSARVSLHVLHLIAQAHDQQSHRGPSEAGWSALVADREKNAQGYAEYDYRRSKFMTLLQNGQARDALALDPVAAVPAASAPVLRIDAWRLQGIALVLDDRPREAVSAFLAARQLAAAGHPYPSANLALLLSDALRRAGDGDGADRAWHEAAALAGDLAVAPIPLADPILWERAAYLRPATAAWPDQVRRQLADQCGRNGLIFAENGAASVSSAAETAGEAALWANVGQWRLQRDEPQAALVALKRAESLTPDPSLRSRLQLLQAKALVRLGQTPAATAILVQAAGGTDPRLARPALAVLGAARLREGGSQQGFQLLRRAVEEAPVVEWPERAEAEADLGLAHLLLGDETAGLRWLHQAQQTFEATGQYDALCQSLENELAYLESAQKKDLAPAVRQRLDNFTAF